MGTSLLFDDTLELCGSATLADDAGFWFEAQAANLSFGEPQPVEVAIDSLLRDGAITATQSNGNREANFVVTVKATDQLALAQGVAALHSAINKRTTLVWTPPDGYAPPTVFDVETSSLHNPGDFDDLAFKRNEMAVRLRLVCLPFARSATKVVDDAGTPPSSGTVVYNCESATGWAALFLPPTYSPAEYVVDTTIYAEGSGSIRSRAQSVRNDAGTTSEPMGQSSAWDKVSGLAIDTGAGGYFGVAVRFEWTMTNLHFYMTTDVGGRTEITSAMPTKRDANGFVHYVWLVDGGQTITDLEFLWLQLGPTMNDATIHHAWYDDFEIMDAATTEHQIVKQHDVQGSARTIGSLRIAAPAESVALGKVLAITVPTVEIPAGFQPDGRRWVTQGTTTTDATALHGSYYSPGAAYSSAAGMPVFDVPVGMLTAGPYTMVAMVKASGTSVTAGVQAQLLVGGTLTGPTSTAEVTLPNVPTGWQFVVLGTCYLPPLPVQNAATSTKVRLLFKGAPLADVYMIPAWQVGGKSVADFSIVDCGSGTVGPGLASSSLWIDSPSTAQPQGGWWRGPTADRLNAQSAWPDAKKPGVHIFPPGSLTNFVVSTGAAGPTSTLEYYPAWYSSAAS